MTLYEVLGVPPTASPDEIKMAYRSLVKEHHPDAGGDSGQFTIIQKAYETLSDPERRSRYDQTGESDAPVDDPFESAVKNQLANFLNEMLFDSHFVTRVTDYARKVRDQSSRQFAIQRNQIEAERQKAIKIQNAVIKRADVDLLPGVIHQRLSSLDIQSEGINKTEQVIHRALELLEQYEFVQETTSPTNPNIYVGTGNGTNSFSL